MKISTQLAVYGIGMAFRWTDKCRNCGL